MEKYKSQKKSKINGGSGQRQQIVLLHHRQYAYYSRYFYSFIFFAVVGVRIPWLSLFAVLEASTLIDSRRERMTRLLPIKVRILMIWQNRERCDDRHKYICKITFAQFRVNLLRFKISIIVINYDMHTQVPSIFLNQLALPQIPSCVSQPYIISVRTEKHSFVPELLH